MVSLFKVDYEATGPGGISAQMLMLCDESVSLSLQIIFTYILSTSVYPDMWKRAVTRA